MTITLNLPAEIERAFQRETQARGLSLDEFLTESVPSYARGWTIRHVFICSISA